MEQNIKGSTYSLFGVIQAHRSQIDWKTAFFFNLGEVFL